MNKLPLRTDTYIPEPLGPDSDGTVPILIQENIDDTDPGVHTFLDPKKKISNNDKMKDPNNTLWSDNPKYRFDPTTLVPVTIGQMMNKSLLKNLCVPSASHAYSVAVEFFKNWILGKFDKGYFKTVYIDGRHLFDEFANINERW